MLKGEVSDTGLSIWAIWVCEGARQPAVNLSCMALEFAGIWKPLRAYSTTERVHACVRFTYFAFESLLSSMCASAPEEAASETCATVFAILVSSTEHLSKPRTRGGIRLNKHFLSSRSEQHRLFIFLFLPDRVFPQ